MILHLIDLHASLLSFFLHEFHHLMSRRPPEVPHNLRRFFAFEDQPWRLRVSSGRALPQPGRAFHGTPAALWPVPFDTTRTSSLSIPSLSAILRGSVASS